MVKSVEKQLFLRDSDGGVTPFDARELQTRLIRAFLATGLREESYLAEELALALEYTLLQSPRPEPVFDKSEVDTALIRLLEGAGFPEVAAAFRKTGAEQTVRISAAGEALERLVTAHLGCSTERAVRIAGIVAESLAKLNIREASPHLLLELARHFERDLAETDLPEAAPVPASAPRIALSREEISALLPPAPRELAESGVLRISGMTTLFPSIRFFFFMQNFARFHKLSRPVTELALLPRLYTAGTALEEARTAIVRALDAAAAPVCCLTLPDATAFLRTWADSRPDPKLAETLADALTAGIKCELHRLTID